VTTDRYAGSGDDLLAPASDAAAVTKSDTVPLTVASKRLWIGGVGDVNLITVKGTTVKYSAVPAGTYLRVRATQVLATGTTATNIVAEF
jgi:hypothetical protein